LYDDKHHLYIACCAGRACTVTLLPHENNTQTVKKIGAGGDENLVIYFMWPNSLYVFFFFIETNERDCVVFAIANAMAIVNGQIPEEQNYMVSRMRRHLYKLMRHFPAKLRRKFRGNKSGEVQVYYNCRRQEALPMAECVSGKEWFHSTCQTIPKKVWSKNVYWKCSKCKSK